MSGEPTGPWGPAEDANIKTLQYKVETLEKEKEQMQTLLWNMMQDREEARRGRTPSSQELREAWQELLEMDLPDTVRTIMELQSQVNYYKEAEVRWQSGGGTSHAARESLEASRLREEDLQEKTSSLRRLLKEKEDWIETEKIYRSDLDDFRSRLEVAKTASADSDTAAEAFRSCKEELSRVKKKNDELKQKTETAEKRLSVAHSRLEKKDQGAEYSYQRLMEYFELQKEDLNKQLNWMVLRHGKETASYEHELAVKEKRLQAMDAQAQLLREFNPTAETALQSSSISNTLEEDRLRGELDKHRIEGEHLKADSEQKIRELTHTNNKLSGEMTSQSEKITRLERTCQDKSVKIAKFQDKIQSLNEEVRRLEDEAVQKEAATSSDQSRMRNELQSVIDDRSSTVENLTQKIKSSEGAYERLRHDYNDSKRNLNIEKDLLQNKITQIQQESDRMQSDLERDNNELKIIISSRDKEVVKSRELMITSDTETARWRQKCDVMEKEVRVLSEQTSSLLDRDQQLRSEIQIIKIEWNKTELALKHNEKVKRRMGDDLDTLRRRLTAASRVSKHRHGDELLPLAINYSGGSTGAHGSHRKRHSSVADSEPLWSPT